MCIVLVQNTCDDIFWKIYIFNVFDKLFSDQSLWLLLLKIVIPVFVLGSIVVVFFYKKILWYLVMMKLYWDLLIGKVFSNSFFHFNWCTWFGRSSCEILFKLQTNPKKYSRWARSVLAHHYKFLLSVNVTYAMKSVTHVLIDRY